ncbi:hypothetical protein HPP92_011679 [Vanilla planifolia]|uniref:E3 ubiquitin-protein ligase listerin n=1 Tax=Vanilla planifolia TaxID=51239 RepID=A0A835V4M8_VANPL|nr:hypothetical protein HPP92_011679 [Vanilla planifolia]
MKCIPHAYNEGNKASLSAFILGSLQEKDMSCHSSMWDMILLFCRTFPDAWSYINVHKVVLTQLWQFLRNGCYGSQKVSYPALLILLEYLPPQTAKGEQFLLHFFQNLWAGRNPSSSSAADSATFFKAFQECFLWVFEHVTRFSKSEDDAHMLSIKLFNDVLIKLSWYDYIQVNPKILDVSSLEITDAEVDRMTFDDSSAAIPKYSSGYIKKLGKCIMNILMHITLYEINLDHFCATFVKDSLAILQYRLRSSRFQEPLRRIIDFLLLSQHPLSKGQTWPWELLAGPLIASSFSIIKAIDSIDSVEFLSVIVGIYGPVRVVAHIHVCINEHCCLGSTNHGDDDLIEKQFLQTIKDDLVPWCLLKQTQSTGAKLDLLLSLMQDAYSVEQWHAILTHFAIIEKRSRTDGGSSDHVETIQSFVTLFEKLRGKIPSMKENVHGSGVRQEYWHNELLDSIAISIACESPCICLSHAQLLRTMLGGSNKEDNMYFLSRKAVAVIFEEILKTLILYLSTSSFGWARHSCSLLLSLACMDLTVLQKSSVVNIFEVAQFAFQVLEGSIFCLKMLDDNNVLISCILAAIFIVDWEFSMLVLTDDEDNHDLKCHILVDYHLNIDDHLLKPVDAKLTPRGSLYDIVRNILTCFLVLLVCQTWKN